MGDTPHKPLSKLRTFQLDQAHARGEESAAVPFVKQEKKIEATVSAAPKIIVLPVKKETNVGDTKPQLPVSTPPVPPAFHELKKSPKKVEHIIAEVSATPSKKITVRQRAPVPLPRSFSSEASVITSSKKTEFNFFTAILASLKDWVGGLKKRDTTRTYTVTTTDRRKGLIQKATTNSGATFTSNNFSIKDEITKKREGAAEESVHPLHINWSAQTEPGVPLIGESHPPLSLPTRQPVVVEYKKRGIPAPQIVTPETKREEPPKRIFVPPPAPTVPRSTGWESDISIFPDSPYSPTTFQASIPVFRVPEYVSTTSLPVVTPSATSTPPEATITTQQITLDTPEVTRFTKPGTSIPNKPNPKTSYLRRGLRELFRFDTTVATVVVVGSIVSFVMVFLIVKTFLTMITPALDISQAPVSLAEPLTPSGKVVDVAVSALSLDALKSALRNQDRPTRGVVEFRILEASGAPLTGSQLWKILGFSSDPNLSRSINEARFGYSDAEHILVLEVTDAVTVFGALLAWENEMAAEFAPIFEEEIKPITSIEDMTVGSSDIRILKSNDETIMVYGFIGKNVVVVTESLEAYEATFKAYPTQ